MRTIVLLLLIALVGMAITLTACTTEEDVALARAREWDAKARAEAAPVVVIEAETNATLQKLRAVADVDKEMRAFDAQLARQEFAATVLEMQALNLAIREEMAAATKAVARLEDAAADAEPIGHNAFAAAQNSWYTNVILVGFGVFLLGLATLTIGLFARLERRLAGALYPADLDGKYAKELQVPPVS